MLLIAYRQRQSYTRGSKDTFRCDSSLIASPEHMLRLYFISYSLPGAKVFLLKLCLWNSLSVEQLISINDAGPGLGETFVHHVGGVVDFQRVKRVVDFFSFVRSIQALRTHAVLSHA